MYKFNYMCKLKGEITLATFIAKDTMGTFREIVGAIYSKLSENEYATVSNTIRDEVLAFVLNKSSFVKSIGDCHDSKVDVEMKDGSVVTFGMHEGKPQRVISFSVNGIKVKPTINENGDMVMESSFLQMMSRDTKRLINEWGGIFPVGDKFIISSFGVKLSNFVPVVDSSHLDICC